MKLGYLVVLLLAGGVNSVQIISAQIGECDHCFSEPQSTLLFSPLNVNPDDGQYALVASGGIFAIPRPPLEVGNHTVSSWVLSPKGDFVAGALVFMLNKDEVKCDPAKPTWCDPHPRPIYKRTLGVYSVQERTWKQYGDFQEVGLPAFSFDGKQIAFKAEKGCYTAADSPCDAGIMILNLDTGQLRTLPGTTGIVETRQLSWSPDGKFLALTSNANPGYGQIMVIDVATGDKKVIAEGSDPSWSPKGDWIAYASTVNCMIVHPDGTGARSVLPKGRKWTSYTQLSPILWSPDGGRLLLNQRKAFDSGVRVVMVNLATGDAVIKSEQGEFVTGWAPAHGD